MGKKQILETNLGDLKIEIEINDNGTVTFLRCIFSDIYYTIVDMLFYASLSQLENLSDTVKEIKNCKSCPDYNVEQLLTISDNIKEVNNARLEIIRLVNELLDEDNKLIVSISNAIEEKKKNTKTDTMEEQK